MTEKQVENLLNQLLSTARRGSKQAATAYSELSTLLRAWRKKPTADNWNDVVYHAQGVGMWVEPEENQEQEKRPDEQ